MKTTSSLKIRKLTLRIIDDGGLLLVDLCLAPSMTVSFGSAPGNDYELSGEGVAPTHLTIGSAASGVWVESAAGAETRLGGDPLRGRIIAPGRFVVEAGTARIEVEMEDAGRGSASASELIGMVLCGYRLDQLLGDGPFWALYRATQVKLDRQVVLKVLAAHGQAGTGRTRRFLHTVELAARLNHPNLVRVYDSGFDEARGLHFKVMESLDETRTLAQVVAQQTRLPGDAVLPIVTQIAAALEHLHEQGTLHRNLHPGNILVLPNQRIKLAGLSQLGLEGSEAPDVPDQLDAAVYLAPEQFTGKADARSDLYAAGAIAYRCLSGELPLLGTTLALHHAALARGELLPPLSRKARAGFEDLARVIERCLQYNPNERFPNASALRGEMRAMTSGSSNDQTLARMRTHLSAMLPASSQVPGFQSAVLYRPAQGVGGDFYDVFPCNQAEEWGLVVGDVTGHGMEAMSIAGMAKMAIRIMARRTQGPKNALLLAHRELASDLARNTFVSAILLRIDPATRQVRYARAGQNPPLLYNPQRTPPVQTLQAAGMALGMIKHGDLTLEERQLELLPGDLLLVMTDGIVETPDLQGRQFGLERLIHFLRDSYTLSPQQLALELAGVLEQYSIGDREEAVQEDDWTALFLKLPAD